MLLVLPLCFLSSCCTKKSVVVDNNTHVVDSLQERITYKESIVDSLCRVILMRDSIEHSHTERDSTYNNVQRSDTLIVTDSVYTKVFADGSTLTERFHNEYRYFYNTIIQYRDRTTKDYLSEYTSEVERANHLLLVNTSLTDSLTMLRDSIASYKKEVVKVQQPILLKWLAGLGAAALLTFLVWAFFKLLNRGTIGTIINRIKHID